MLLRKECKGCFEKSRNVSKFAYKHVLLDGTVVTDTDWFCNESCVKKAYERSVKVYSEWQEKEKRRKKEEAKMARRQFFSTIGDLWGFADEHFGVGDKLTDYTTRKIVTEIKKRKRD